MAEQGQTQPEGKPVLTPARGASEDKIIPPVEIASAKNGIRVTLDQDEVTIDIAGLIAEDIGCYRRVKIIRVKFKEGQAPQIVPIALEGPITN
ncbi:MAG: hypothetical protein ACXABY_15755 [Candidatus Thorarchaeota archaeon]